MTAKWRDVVVSPDTCLGEVITLIDNSGLQVALIVKEDGTLAGILTDGNIRRAILNKKTLQTPVHEVMNTKPTSVMVNTSRVEMIAVMQRTTYHHLPLIDESHRVVGLATLDELLGSLERPNWVVVMAGGQGKRLMPLTKDCPKPLLTVHGKPILETIIESFSEQGFKKFFLSVNYKAEMIEDYFGFGEQWGVQIEYLHEDIQLGTAGALSLLPEKPVAPIIVMNGDLLSHINFSNLLRFHEDHTAIATMAVREYDFQIPYGVVRVDGIRIQAIEEKPVQKFFVNAGIYTFSPEALDSLPNNIYYDMPDFFAKLKMSGKITVAYPLREYWLDIGKLEEFERAQREWMAVPA